MEVLKQKLPNEDSRDHQDATFEVYEFNDRDYRVLFKVMCNNDGKYLHYMRLYKK